MPHQTTVVEVAIQPADLFLIVQEWAKNTGFSLYEKRDHRAIYSKKMRGGRAWLAVEAREERGKLEAWLSSGQLGPEFEGNLLVGWKMALPEGFAIGTPRAYKKQFNQLLGLIRTKSTSITSPQQAALKRSIFTKGLTLFGIICLVGGVINLVSGITIESSYPSLARHSLVDGFSELVLGTLLLLSSRALKQGKSLGIWLYGTGMAVKYISSFAKGEPLNYFFMGLTLLIIWQVFKSKKEWELS